MGEHASAGVTTGLLALALAACNALLGTPEPELAPEGGADGGEALDGGGDVDATTPKDGTTSQDSQSTPDSTGPDGGSPDTAPADAAALDGDASTQDVAAAEAGSDASPTPPSCQGDGGPGVTRCGASGESCCTSLEVPAGTYFRSFAIGPDGGGTGYSYQATVSGFRLDKYEVTVGRFRQFVDASQTWSPPVGSGVHAHLRDGGGLEELADGATIYETGWNAAWNASMSQYDGGGAGHWNQTLLLCTTDSTWTDLRSTQESLPINCLNWFEAYAFCIWDGGFLPSDAEWGYAAAGGVQQRLYPWGWADPGVDNQYAIYGCDYPDGGQVGVDAAGTCNSIAHIAPVGSAPLGAGLWQQLDLGGNVNEPTLDWFVPYAGGACGDCAQLTVPPGPLPGRTARGGSWWVQPAPLLNDERFEYTPDTRDLKGGVRCARAP